MANLFEKPIAATPISTFAAMPLQYIQSSLDRKQQMYEKAKAEMMQTEDTLAQTRALGGDAPRHQELLSGYDERLDEIVESVDGDYSQVGGSLDLFKRDLKRDINYGELGAINRAFTTGMKEKENLTKLYEQGKISDAGYQMGLQALGKHKTELNDYNQWSSYQGYQPSNIVDPLKVLQDSADEISAKYDEEGRKNISQEDVISNINSKVQNMPGLVNAMKENWIAGGSQGSFEDYYANTVKGVVRDKSYQQTLKAIEGGKGKATPFVFNNIGMPDRTSSMYAGGTVPGLRSLVDRTFGTQSTKKFDDYLASKRGQEEVAWMEAKSGTKMPEGHTERVEWIENNLENAQVGSIETGAASQNLIKQIITDEGMLTTRGAVYDKSGNLLDADDIQNLQGKTEEGNKTRIVGTVSAGGTYPVGTYVILGKDAEPYFQEPSDVATLQSPEYAESLINMAKHSSTGRSVAELKRPLRNPKTGQTLIPAGNYETRSAPDGSAVGLYQNGELMYFLDASGQVRSTKEED